MYCDQPLFSFEIKLSIRWTNSGNRSSPSYGSTWVRKRNFSCLSDSQVVR